MPAPMGAGDGGHAPASAQTAFELTGVGGAVGEAGGDAPRPAPAPLAPALAPALAEGGAGGEGEPARARISWNAWRL